MNYKLHDELLAIQRRVIALFDVTGEMTRCDPRCADLEQHNIAVAEAMVGFMHCCLHSPAQEAVGLRGGAMRRRQTKAVVISRTGAEWNAVALEKFRKLLIQALTETAPAGSRVKEGRKTK